MKPKGQNQNTASSKTPMSSKNINLDTDGVTHINIYSRGVTALGRALSHFTHSPFVHPYFGPFDSMEGFWFYMRNGQHMLPPDQRDDNYRYLSGYKAKQYGREHKRYTYPHFQEDIMAANYQKIIQTRNLKDMLVKSTLPFAHYYLFGEGTFLSIIQAREANWLCEGFEEIRKALKNDEVPLCWQRAEQRYVADVVENKPTSSDQG